MKPVCLVFGAGAGIGGTVAAKFAEEGYHSFLCRRSDQEGLDKLIGDIEASGGSASGQLLNAIEEDAIEEVINCLLYTSPSPRDATLSRMPSSA